MLNNQRGHVSKAFIYSVGLHGALVAFLIVAPQLEDNLAVDQFKKGSIEIFESTAVAEVPVEITVQEKISRTTDKILKATAAPKSEGVVVKELSKEKEIVKTQPAKAVVEKISEEPKVASTIIPEARAEEPVIIEEETENLENDEQLASNSDPELTEANAETEDSVDHEAHGLSEAEEISENLLEDEGQNTEEVAPIAESNPLGEKITDQLNQKEVGSPTGVQDARSLKQMSGNPKPLYPQRSRRFREAGTVLLKYNVDKNGSVQNIKVAQSSGHSLLDQEAIRAVKQWKFVPGQEGATVHPVSFNLNGQSQTSPSRLRTKALELKNSKDDQAGRLRL